MGKKGKKGGGGGGKNSIMNGRALFSYNPDLFVDDEGQNDEPTNAKDEEEKQADEDGEDGQEAIEEEDNEDDDQIKENGTTDNAQ